MMVASELYGLIYASIYILVAIFFVMCNFADGEWKGVYVQVYVNDR